jgi:protein-S-isoprenylcysteine O-methyltransferase Ste14
MNMGWLVIVVGVLGLVALSRYFRHLESMRMLEIGRSAEETLEFRERWRTRQGFLTGAVLLVVGIVFLVSVSSRAHFLRPGVEGFGDFVSLLGLLLVAVGLVIAVSYWLWARQSVPSESRSGENVDTASPDSESGE